MSSTSFLARACLFLMGYAEGSRLVAGYAAAGRTCWDTDFKKDKYLWTEPRHLMRKCLDEGFCPKSRHLDRNTDNTRPRTPLPKFVLDDAFRVVGGEADTRWVLNFQQHAEDTKKLFDVLAGVPISNPALAVGQWVFSTIGGDVRQEQPSNIKVDLTDLFRKLNATIQKSLKDQSFQGRLKALSSSASFVADTMTELGLGFSNGTVLSKLETVTNELWLNYHNHLSDVTDIGQYAFFLVSPMSQHILMYSATALDEIQASQHVEGKRPCSYLKQHRRRLEQMRCTFVKYLARGALDRFMHTRRGGQRAWSECVGSKPCVVGDCECTDEFCIGRDEGRERQNTITTVYEWIGDTWPALAMQPIRESWEVTMTPRNPQRGFSTFRVWSGVWTDGRAWYKEIQAYERQAQEALNEWARTHLEAIGAFINLLDELVPDLCRLDELDEVGLSTEVCEVDHDVLNFPPSVFPTLPEGFFR